MEPPIIQEKRRNFMNICKEIDMPYEKACLLCNAYIHKITIQCMYHKEIEESIKGITILLKLQNKKPYIIHDCINESSKGKG